MSHSTNINMNTNYTDNFNQSFSSQTQCETWQLSIPSDVRGPLVSSVAILVTYFPLGVFTAFANLIFIIAIIRKERLRTAANLILTSMAVSDFLVGIIVIPLKIIIEILNLHQSSACLLRQVNFFCAPIFIYTSLINTLFFAADRFFATVLPFRYLQHVIYKKYVAAIISAWLLIILVSLLTALKVLDPRVMSNMGILLYSSCIIVVAISYCYIYKASRAHRRRIRLPPVSYSNVCPIKSKESCVENTTGIEMQRASKSTLEKGTHAVFPSASTWSSPSNIQDTKVEESIFESDLPKTNSVARPVSNNIEDQSVTQTPLKANSLEGTAVCKNIENQSPPKTPPKKNIVEGTDVSKNIENQVVIQTPIIDLSKHAPSDDVNSSHRLNIATLPDPTATNINISTTQRSSRNFTVLIIIGSLLITYLPIFALNFIRRLPYTTSTSTLIVAFDWCNTVVYSNSAINPIIYCWRVGSIRDEMRNTLYKLFR